jgi:hypothetical protein
MAQNQRNKRPFLTESMVFNSAIQMASYRMEEAYDFAVVLFGSFPSVSLQWQTLPATQREERQRR